MREVEVDAVDAEALEAAGKLPPDPVGSKALVARRAGRRVEDLRRQPDPLGPLLGQPASDELLAPPASVGVAGVEPMDAAGPRRVHDRDGRLLVDPLAEELGRRSDAAEVPAAERNTVKGHHSGGLR